MRFCTKELPAWPTKGTFPGAKLKLKLFPKLVSLLLFDRFFYWEKNEGNGKGGKGEKRERKKKDDKKGGN